MKRIRTITTLVLSGGSVIGFVLSPLYSKYVEEHPLGIVTTWLTFLPCAIFALCLIIILFLLVYWKLTDWIAAEKKVFEDQAKVLTEAAATGVSTLEGQIFVLNYRLNAAIWSNLNSGGIGIAMPDQNKEREALLKFLSGKYKNDLKPAEIEQVVHRVFSLV